MKKIFLSIMFIILIVIILNKYDNIVTHKFNKYFYKYYDEKKIDVLFIGSSKIVYSISPMYIWNKYGIVSYNRGLNAQYYKNTFYLTKEVIQRNKPKLVVVETFFFKTMGKFSATTPQIQNMKFSPLKVQAYLDNLDDARFDNLDNKPNYLDIYISNINRYHTRWKNLVENDFHQVSYFKGLNIIRGSFFMNPQTPYIPSYRDTQWASLDDKESIKYLEELVEYANLNGVKILFINAPYIRTKTLDSLDELFMQLCKKNNWDCLDYNLMYNELRLDFNRDFRDGSHLNFYGSLKLMEHLIPYIIENYNIPIRKDDPKYASWNEDYIKYARAVNREEIRELKSFQEWQNLAYYDNYTMLISTNGDDVLNRLPQAMKDKFKSLGLNKFETDKTNQKYAAIIDNNKVFFEEISDNKVEYKGRMKNKVNLLVSSEPNKAIINVSGKPRSKNRYGINFVIYDKVNREIVDSIWVDTAQPDVIRR